MRSFKIKTSWSSDASSTANTIVSSQVRTNCHPFIHSFLNLFILYGLMQKYLLSQLPCKKMIFVCTTEAKACSITSLLSSSPLQPFSGLYECLYSFSSGISACLQDFQQSMCVFSIHYFVWVAFLHKQVFYIFLQSYCSLPPISPFARSAHSLIVRIFHWFLWFPLVFGDGPW